jgi:hypothetical protein
MPQTDPNYYKRTLDRELETFKRHKPNSSQTILTSLIKKEGPEASETTESMQKNFHDLPALIEENAGTALETMAVEYESRQSFSSAPEKPMDMETSNSNNNDLLFIEGNTTSTQNPLSGTEESGREHQKSSSPTSGNSTPMDILFPALCPDAQEKPGSSKALQEQVDAMKLVDFQRNNYPQFEGPKYVLKKGCNLRYFASKPFPDTKSEDYEFDSKGKAWVFKTPSS